MISLQTHINNYTNHCQHQKQLDAKTLKAYRIDLAQFSDFVSAEDITNVTSDILEDYICGCIKSINLKQSDVRLHLSRRSSVISNTKILLNTILSIKCK